MGAAVRDKRRRQFWLLTAVAVAAMTASFYEVANVAILIPRRSATVDRVQEEARSQRQRSPSREVLRRHGFDGPDDFEAARARSGLRARMLAFALAVFFWSVAVLAVFGMYVLSRPSLDPPPVRQGESGSD